VTPPTVWDEKALAGATGLTGALGPGLTLNGIEALAVGCSLCLNYSLSARWAFAAAARRA
jgi:hypothetical protein